jgi:hypothetical protein
VTRPADGERGLAPAERDRLTQGQAFEDAIAYRRARLSAPCPDCGPDRCDEHATDADLITWYQQGAAALLQRARSAGPAGTGRLS